ncbi:DEAD/DEAH box helicase [Streptomyces sp. NPDC046900]|uniref:DEAD/DEAH box helicase n=1 Tax=Streptomyces sp. NPDC046900 TaxID=3155473 RepID=UPI0033D4D219
MTDSTEQARRPEAADILGSFQALRDTLMRYYDTPFAVEDPSVMKERRALLDTDGGAWREPLLELRPQYAPSGVPVAGSFRAAGAHPQAADFAQFALPSGVEQLYRHQHDALVAACRDGRDIVVTAGTGSGKTEAFMLPIIADLVAESARWPGRGATQAAWWRGNGGYEPSRVGEVGHQAALRALVLYPTNALADDQLVRLRRALDSDAARDWLERNRSGHRFYFGRYTSATPVSGSAEAMPALDRMRSYMRELDEREQRAAGHIHDFTPRVCGAEMHARWDMQHAAPDVLVTNYSMLNIMLLRPQEAPMFEATRRWLDTTPGARFTLVLDELHMYRGTAGTEVAYLLRKLRHRLGLESAPEKFRVLAASASLEAGRDDEFLESFFALPRGRHVVVPGTLALPEPGSTDLTAHAQDLAAAAEGDLATEPAGRLLQATGAADALALTLAPDGKPQAQRLSRTAAQLFPGLPSQGEQAKALHGVLRALGAASNPALPKLRAHMFFRNIDGIWACSDPQCPDVPGGRHPQRRIGRLFRAPTSRCSCGARVLELLYCQNCGDLMLGGFTSPTLLGKATFRGSLHTDFPDFDQLPDDATGAASAGNYVVYWPRKTQLGLESPEWTASQSHQGAKATFQFRPSRYQPGTGRLANDKAEYTGWSFHVVPDKDKEGKPALDIRGLKAIPTRCPACGDDWEVKRARDPRTGAMKPIGLEDPARLRSTPVRRMRTGFDKLNQVLTTEALGHMPEGERKVIAFSDSRDDAAELASGLSLRHYQDLLRLMAAEVVERQGDPHADLQLVKAHYAHQPVDREQVRAALQRLRDRHPRELSALRDILNDEIDAEPERQPELESVLGSLPSLQDLRYDLRGLLLDYGVNPGGPAASLQNYNGIPWTALFDWKKDRGLKPGLTEEQEEYLRRIEDSLGREFVFGLFSGAGRDFESLGLGWLSLSGDRTPLDMPPDSDVALARASLRILGLLRRFTELRAGSEKPPAPLLHFWKKIAQRDGTDFDTVKDRVLAAWGQAVAQYIIDPSKVSLRPGDGRAWICGSCRRPHLHRGVGLCTKCQAELPDTPAQFTGALNDDYYAWKARTRTGNFALRAAELTGQTDRIDAQSRQARFQDVFIGEDDVPDADGIEVLSVTTTMEAGVDVGSLNTVLLANMPPTRFNYQQRVGRAGRRGSPAATALTICRGRSHDEHYFARPEEITNAPTPPPYLALDMRPIFERVLLGEVLRQAFDAVAAARGKGDPDLTKNIHGQFGFAADWPVHREAVRRWVDGHHADVESAARALQAATPEPVASIDPIPCVKELLDRVDAKAASATGHAELSQRLAEAGLLPMFGFPTRVRYLYTERPETNFPWPPPGAIDRNLAVALAKFAPGSETPRDGRLYQSMGVVSFRPGRTRPWAEDEPFGPEARVALCRLCAHIKPLEDGEEPKSCPACGASGRNYAALPMREPAGFRAGTPRDYDGVREWGQGGASSRTAADLEKDAPRVHRSADDWLVAHAGSGDRFTINSNNGRLYRFKRVHGSWGGYHVVDSPKAQADLETALGATEHTDMLFLGARAPLDADRGLRFDLSSYEQPHGFRDAYHGRRAAWYSLAALLRRAAAPFLDVQPEELLAGIHGSATASSPVLAYLADSLENGAGFSTHLGAPEHIEDFLDAVEGYLAGLGADHAAECSGSCYRCLRDYSNMRLHPLLDWRLAKDLISVLRGRQLAVDTAAHSTLLKRWAEDRTDLSAEVCDTPFGCIALAQGEFAEDTFAVVVKHPLESAELTAMAPRLREVGDFVRSSGLAERTAFADAYCLDRIPAAVTSELVAFAEEGEL